MKFTTIFVAVVATGVVASPFAAHNGTADDMPKCAGECIKRFVTELTNCKISDYKCICDKKSQAAIMKPSSKCIMSSCTMNQVIKAKSVAEKTCKATLKDAEAEAPGKNTTMAHNTTIHARTFIVRNTTVHGMAAIGNNFTANRTTVSA
ncbi:hypothetical protein ARSEF4850_008395 [Beauveria asiatica]